MPECHRRRWTATLACWELWNTTRCWIREHRPQLGGWCQPWQEGRQHSASSNCSLCPWPWRSKIARRGSTRWRTKGTSRSLHCTRCPPPERRKRICSRARSQAPQWPQARRMHSTRMSKAQSWNSTAWISILKFDFRARTRCSSAEAQGWPPPRGSRARLLRCASFRAHLQRGWSQTMMMA